MKAVRQFMRRPTPAGYPLCPPAPVMGRGTELATTVPDTRALTSSMYSTSGSNVCVTVEGRCAFSALYMLLSANAAALASAGRGAPEPPERHAKRLTPLPPASPVCVTLLKQIKAIRKALPSVALCPGGPALKRL